jgi:integrase
MVRLTLAGGRKDITLGQFPVVGLADARKLAKQEIRNARTSQKCASPVARLKREKTANTFGDCASKYIEAHRAEWSQSTWVGWVQTMRDYASPVIGRMAVNQVDTDAVMAILGPIWEMKTETAVRVRSRIEAILDWAAVKRLRSGENPARWRGHLRHLLADRNKVSPVKHHEALPFRDIPEFIAKLRACPDHAAPALLFAILTAARSGEARGATWGEMDSAADQWVIPPNRMKAGKEHRVPLAADVVALIGERPKQAAAKDIVFPGLRSGGVNGRMISHPAFARVMRSIGYPTLTTHGFRSSFRDWAAETTDHPNEVVEMALAHAIGSKVEAAYRRGNLMDKRRKLMEEWGAYCLSGVQDFTAKTIRNNITTRGQTCTATNMGDLSE